MDFRPLSLEEVSEKIGKIVIVAPVKNPKRKSFQVIHGVDLERNCVFFEGDFGLAGYGKIWNIYAPIGSKTET